MAGRALTVSRTTVPPAQRERFLERARARKHYYAGAACRYWVCEERGLPGSFIEFVEADDEKTLTAAHGGAPEAPFDPRRVYQEAILG